METVPLWFEDDKTLSLWRHFSTPGSESGAVQFIFIHSHTRAHTYTNKSSVYVMVAKTIGQVDGIMNVERRTEMEGVRLVTGGIQRLLIRAEN